MKILKNQINRYLISALILILIIIIAFKNYNIIISFLKLLTNGPELKKYLDSFGYLSGLIFLVFQIIQVFIFVIPGEVIQTASGYVFGTLWGFFISFMGIGIGSAMLFLISHKYGRYFVKKIVSKDVYNRFEKILSGKRKWLIILIVYLIPGMPKDSLIMLCALSSISIKDFIIWSMIGRIPALFVSIYFGSNIAGGNHKEAIIICVVAAIIIGILLLFRERVLEKLKNI